MLACQLREAPFSPLSFALCFSKCRGNFSTSVISYSFQFPLGMFKANRLLSTRCSLKSFQQTVQIQFSYNIPPFTFFRQLQHTKQTV